MSIRNMLLLLLPFSAMGASQIAPPAVTLQAIAQKNRLETHGGFRGPSTIESLPVVLVVSNASDRELRTLKLVLPPNSEFSVTKGPEFPSVVPPYGTFLGHLTLQPQGGLAYGHHDFLLAVEYRWKAGAAELISTRTAAVPVEVKRPFEEEAKGLPGGTAALFWLLLPVFPAFFTYELVDRWRRGEGFQVPTFGSEYLLPAFFIGLAVSSFGLGSRAIILVAAAAAGALWPALRWGWDTWQRRRWAFREDDTDSEYLRKALLSPRAQRRFWQATGERDGNPWLGVRLAQPDGRLVLGSRLQLIAKEADRAVTEELLKKITGDDWRKTRRELYAMVERKTLTLSRMHTVEPLDVIATDDLEGFTLKETVETDLLALTS